MILALNTATLLGMAGIAATGIWLFALLRPVTNTRTIALNMLYPIAQLVFIGFFRWCLALSRTTPSIAMMVPLPVCCAVCIVGNLLMFPNLPISERSRQFEREASQLHAATEASLKDLREQRTDIEQALQWQDGVNGQIAALRRALADHDLAGVEQATNMIADAAGRGRARLCDHPAANALLLAECERMRDRGIAVDCVAEIPRDIGIDGAALCAVIGNLLDNATNACSPAPRHVSDSGETDKPHAELTPQMTDSPETDNQRANSAPQMTDSGETDNQTTDSMFQMTDSGETDKPHAELTPQMTDSPETDNQRANSAPQMTDSGETDTQTPETDRRMSDSPESDTGRAWVSIRIAVKHGKDLVIRVSNTYVGNTYNGSTHDGNAQAGNARHGNTARARNGSPRFGEHGWGMRIVDEITRQQHGTFTYGVGEDVHHGSCWYAIATLAARTAPATGSARAAATTTPTPMQTQTPTQSPTPMHPSHRTTTEARS